MTGPKTWEKATPEQVISSLVKKAGGTAVVEPGAGRMRIRQSRNQSVLDLIGSIASDTGVEWVEVDGVIYVGTRGGRGRTTRPGCRRGRRALTVCCRISAPVVNWRCSTSTRALAWTTGRTPPRRN